MQTYSVETTRAKPKPQPKGRITSVAITTLFGTEIRFVERYGEETELLLSNIRAGDNAELSKLVNDNNLREFCTDVLAMLDQSPEGR